MSATLPRQSMASGSRPPRGTAAMDRIPPLLRHVITDAVGMEHARQEREAGGQCHRVVDHEVSRVDLALCRVIEHTSGEVPLEVHVDIELLAGARLRDGVVVVVAKQEQPPAACELRSNRHALPFLCLFTPR